jgi:hypothetical protein
VSGHLVRGSGPYLFIVAAEQFRQPTTHYVRCHDTGTGTDKLTIDPVRTSGKVLITFPSHFPKTHQQLDEYRWPGFAQPW